MAETSNTSSVDGRMRVNHTRIGSYDLLVPLGTGGMATVYLARDSENLGFDRFVAVKLLHPHLREEENLSSDFLREGALSALLRHPNTVAVTECKSTAQGLYLVMEYIDGEALSTLTRAARKAKLPIPIEATLQVLIDGCRGLHAAHELAKPDGTQLNLVHRDVSPQNLLVTNEGLTKLSDFGIARVSDRSSATAQGVIKGKIRYVAPELLHGRVIDRRADIWAMGVVAWELVAGRRLFDGDETEVLIEILGKKPPRIDDVSDVAKPIADAVMGALEREPDLRIPTAKAFADLLEQAAKDAGVVPSREAVAQVCRDLAGDRQKARAEALREALDRQSSVDAGPVVDETAASGVNTNATQLNPPRKLTPYVLVGAGLLVVGAATVGLISSHKTAADDAVSPVLTAASSASAAPIASESAAPPASAIPAAIKVRRDLTVTAPASIAHLSIVAPSSDPSGSVPVELAVPAAAKRMRLPPVDVGSTVTVTLADGRKADAEVDATSPLQLVFPPPPKASGRPPAAGHLPDNPFN